MMFLLTLTVVLTVVFAVNMVSSMCFASSCHYILVYVAAKNGALGEISEGSDRAS